MTTARAVKKLPALHAKGVYSISDVAFHLQMSYNQVLRLVLKGELRGYRDGRRWYVEGQYVNRFILNRETV